MIKKKCVISGGTGLLGSYTSIEMAKAGYEVYVLSRKNETPKIFKDNPKIKVIKWDAKSTENWGEYIDESTILINLAGENPGASRWDKSFKEKILESRMNAIYAMEEAITKYKPLALIQASAVGIYGNCPNYVISDREDFLPKVQELTEKNEKKSEGEIFRSEVCIKMESYCKEMVKKTETPLVLLRIGCIFSSKSGVYPYLLMAGRCGVSKIGDGKQKMSWIHYSDAARSIEFISSKLIDKTPNVDGVYHLSAPSVNSLEEILKNISKQYYLALPNFIPIPSFIFTNAFGESSSVLLDSNELLPDKLQDLGFDFSFKTIDEATKNLSLNLEK